MVCLDRLARQAEVADESRSLSGRRRRLCPDVAFHHAGETVGLAASDDPLEQTRVLARDLERRVARAHTL